ncbi:MAG TPA: hypothetical protein VJN50_02635 [Actinomycetota bacterium]|nr:hypothetical protein [Actinomycetota bacterium]
MSEYIYGTGTKRSKVARYPSQRRCSEPACATILSIYNASSYCSLHASLVPRTRNAPTWRRDR